MASRAHRLTEPSGTTIRRWERASNTTANPRSTSPRPAAPARKRSAARHRCSSRTPHPSKRRQRSPPRSRLGRVAAGSVRPSIGGATPAGTRPSAARATRTDTPRAFATRSSSRAGSATSPGKPGCRRRLRPTVLPWSAQTSRRAVQPPSPAESLRSRRYRRCLFGNGMAAAARAATGHRSAAENNRGQNAGFSRPGDRRRCRTSDPRSSVPTRSCCRSPVAGQNGARHAGMA